MNSLTIRRCGWLIVATGLAASCDAPPPLRPRVASCSTRLRIAQDVKDKVDILFVLDNSPGMGPKLEELQARIPRLLQPFEELATKGVFDDLHFAVITTDYGAGATGAPGCQPAPGGQRGRVQSASATGAHCQGPIGEPFIHYRYRPRGAESNLPPGQDLAATLRCIADVGVGGCAFEHPLEAARAALRDDLGANRGFVRRGALLVVVFFSDEDDASAPAETDLFDSRRVAEYGALASYRATRFGVVCGDPPRPPPAGESSGSLNGCRPAPNPYGAGPGKLHDVRRYIDFFKQPEILGGAKDNPLDVLLVGIVGPPEPFRVAFEPPGGAERWPDECAPAMGQAPCAPRLQPSCTRQDRPEISAAPAVRLKSVVESVTNHWLYSICGDDYGEALDPLAKLIVVSLGGGCLSGSLPDPARPDCVVEDQTRNYDGSTTLTRIPTCDLEPGRFPCWRLEKKLGCESVSPQGLGFSILRNGEPPPDNTDLVLRCEVRCE